MANFRFFHLYTQKRGFFCEFFMTIKRFSWSSHWNSLARVWKGNSIRNWRAIMGCKKKALFITSLCETLSLVMVNANIYLFNFISQMSIFIHLSFKLESETSKKEGEKRKKVHKLKLNWINFSREWEKIFTKSHNFI